MSQDNDNKEEKQERRDFFISYTGRDKPWAEWIAAQLDAAGYTFFFQAWDFRPGSNFVIEMDQAAKLADRTLLVLSAAYQQSGFARSEWAVAFRQDPTGSERRLLPVRIEACALDGLLAQIGYIDLVGYAAEQAKERLLASIQTGRVRPTHVPFPGQQVATAAFPGAFPAHWNIPFARNPFFTGREDLLERLHAQLHATQTVAVSHPQAVSGLGGIGKTQLAIEYAYRYGGEYQAVLWARAETAEALNASFTEIARTLDLPQKEAQEQEVVVQAVKDWLRNTHGWLLVLDNADDLNLAQTFLPTRYTGHLLLTTRAQIMGKFARRLEVETLNPEVGALLLLRRAGLLTPDAPLAAASPSDHSMALTLTEELGGLPLALDQAGAYIEETQCSLADYHQQYQAREAELLAHRGMLVDDHPEPVATTWSLSFAQVEAASPAAAELLRACAFLAPDVIPEELLMEALKIPLSSSKTLDEAVATLRRYSLLQRNLSEKTVKVHRLVQAVMRDTIRKQEQLAWITRVVIAVSILFPEGEFRNWKQCARYLPQALTCAQLILQENLMCQESALLLCRAGGYLRSRAQYREAEPLLKYSVILYEQELGAMHPAMAQSLNNLAELYHDQGNYEQAERLYQQALDIPQRILGNDHPETATSLNNLARLYHDQGNYEQAERLYQRALGIRQRILGNDHPETAATLNHLAKLYYVLGRYEEAEPIFRQSLDIRQRFWGKDYPETATSLNNLGRLYYRLREYVQAELFLLEALDIRQRILREDHPATAISLNNLAELYHDQGNYEQAERLYQQALDIRQRILGKHTETATTLNNLGRLYRDRKEYEKAEPFFQQALAIRQQVLRNDHYDTATCLDDLAKLYHFQKRYKQAERLYRQALLIREQVLGDAHRDTANTLNNLATLYADQERDAETELLLARVRGIGASDDENETEQLPLSPADHETG